MRFYRCDREEAVRIAAASGRWTPILEGHAAVCGSCAEVRMVTEVLTAPPSVPPLAVNPLIVWARAKQRAEVARAARIARILTVGQIAAASIVLVTLIGAAVLVAQIGSTDHPSTFGFGDTMETAMAAGILLTAATLWLSRWVTQPGP